MHTCLLPLRPLQPAMGTPLQGFAASQVFGVAVPAAPAYVKLPLSSLNFDTSGTRGLYYALVLSASAPVNWHSVSSPATDFVPATGTAAALGSWATADSGASWATALPYRGAWLVALKALCSPTPSQSQTASSSPTATRSVTATPQITQTPSQSQTLSRSASQSASQTSTGFPRSPLLDNTAGGAAPINVSGALASVAASPWIGISFYLPEADPVCGPGTYRLQALTAALSASVASLPLTLLLYPADPATGAPLTSSSYLRSPYFPSAGPLSPAPAYVTVTLPASWTLDATALRWYSLVLYAASGAAAASWYEAADNTTDHVPVTGFGAVVAGLWTSTDSGASWAALSRWPGLQVSAQKTACSPTPTRTQTQTPSGTPSGTQSPSESATPSASGTPALSATSTPTPSATPVDGTVRAV